jgi:hypothetical protein
MKSTFFYFIIFYGINIYAYNYIICEHEKAKLAFIEQEYSYYNITYVDNKLSTSVFIRCTFKNNNIRCNDAGYIISLLLYNNIYYFSMRLDKQPPVMDIFPEKKCWLSISS